MGPELFHFMSLKKKNSPVLATISMMVAVLASHIAPAADSISTAPASSLEAPEKTCCICTVGTEPSWQVPAFKLGCMHWLARQSGCDVKKTVSDWASIKDAASPCKGGKVKLGYVGHGDEYKSDSILYSSISGLVNPSGLGASVDFDNTSCLALADAAQVKRQFDHLPMASGKYIRVTGSQSVSVGEFDHVLPGLLQINATIDTRKKMPEYPLCSQVQDAACLNVQKGNQVICDTKDHTHVILICSKAPDPYRFEFNDDMTEKMSLRWTRSGTISDKELLAPPKNIIDPGLYECIAEQDATAARFFFRDYPDGSTYVTVEAPALNTKAYGILTNSKNDLADFRFTESKIRYMNAFSVKHDAAGLTISTVIAESPYILSYSHCKKLDAPLNATTPCTTIESTPLAPEQSTTLKSVESALSTKMQN
jgi:hypothetical protein